jgi:hypothetical protein
MSSILRSFRAAASVLDSLPVRPAMISAVTSLASIDPENSAGGAEARPQQVHTPTLDYRHGGLPSARARTQ